MTKSVKITLFIVVGLALTILLFRPEISEFLFLRKVILWSPDYEVDLKDYIAEPDLSSESKIYGYHGFYLKFRGCDKEDYRVEAFFDPEKSWVKNKSLVSDEELRWQGLHFDLYELYAQKFRNRLDQLHDPCDYGTDSLNSIGDQYFAQVEFIWNRMKSEDISSERDKLTILENRMDEMLTESKERKINAKRL